MLIWTKLVLGVTLTLEDFRLMFLLKNRCFLYFFPCSTTLLYGAIAAVQVSKVQKQFCLNMLLYANQFGGIWDKNIQRSWRQISHSTILNWSQHHESYNVSFANSSKREHDEPRDWKVCSTRHVIPGLLHCRALNYCQYAQYQCCLVVCVFSTPMEIYKDV